MTLAAPNQYRDKYEALRFWGPAWIAWQGKVRAVGENIRRRGKPNAADLVANERLGRAGRRMRELDKMIDDAIAKAKKAKRWERRWPDSAHGLKVAGGVRGEGLGLAFTISAVILGVLAVFVAGAFLLIMTQAVSLIRGTVVDVAAGAQRAAPSLALFAAVAAVAAYFFFGKRHRA